MKQFNLNDEEVELLDSLESDEWGSVENLKDEINFHQTIARNTLKKDKRVNLRMSSKDLEDIKTFAVEEGLPYQTLMSSVLHKFITGRLVDKQAG
ncbi:MAG: antitoxin [Helicobacteraceae bacterium]|nr:antitoxin [Helicobacteraceae bacterium]